MIRDELHAVGVVCHQVGGDLSAGRQAIQPLRPGVDDIDAATESGEVGDQSLDDMACAEDDQMPGGAGGYGLKEKAHLATAGHANVVLQIPTLFGAIVAAGLQQTFRLSDGFGLDASAAEIAREHALAGDDGFSAEFSGDAAAHADDGHDDTTDAVTLLLRDDFPDRRHALRVTSASISPWGSSVGKNTLL